MVFYLFLQRHKLKNKKGKGLVKNIPFLIVALQFLKLNVPVIINNAIIDNPIATSYDTI
jgi:hypothetical protein